VTDHSLLVNKPSQQDVSFLLTSKKNLRINESSENINDKEEEENTNEQDGKREKESHEDDVLLMS
jgi:hypothetical protein